MKHSLLVNYGHSSDSEQEEETNRNPNHPNPNPNLKRKIINSAPSVQLINYSDNTTVNPNCLNVFHGVDNVLSLMYFLAFNFHLSPYNASDKNV